MTGVRDQWAAGSSYEDFMGRWGRRLAAAFVSWLRIPPDVHWLDVGCGTGGAVRRGLQPCGPRLRGQLRPDGYHGFRPTSRRSRTIPRSVRIGFMRREV